MLVLALILALAAMTLLPLLEAGLRALCNWPDASVASRLTASSSALALGIEYMSSNMRR